MVLICGYTTASVSFYVCPFKKSKIITNIDGLEWKRAKWNAFIQRLTRWFEKIAVEKSHALVADNIGIEKYIDENFHKPSYFIPYAANILDLNESVLQKYKLEKFSYHVMIGRLEPENNIEMILDGVVQSGSTIPCLVFANYKTKYGQFLADKYKNCSKIIFSGWASGQENLYQLRHFAKIYFHGHSVGGTNPSLLEAMAAGTYIAAHDNVFNKHVLGKDAMYFASADDVKNIIDGFENHASQRPAFEINNVEKIKTFYNWDNITNMYEKMFFEVLNKTR